MLSSKNAKYKHWEDPGWSGPQASERTRRRYVQKSSEVISSVLKVVYPEDPAQLWTELQTSTTVGKMLDADTAFHPSDRNYLEALAEAYKNSKAWDTRRQVLSVMAYN